MTFHFNRSLIHLQNELFDGTGCISSLLNVARGNTRPLDLYLTETKASDGVQQNLGFLHVCEYNPFLIEITFLKSSYFDGKPSISTT